VHILIIPSWYPNSYNKLNGIFFKEQAEALAKTDNKVGVLAITQVTIQDILKNKKISFENKKFIENNVITYQKDYFILPKLYRKFELCRKRRLSIFKKIFKKYITQEGIPDIIHLHSFFYGNLAMWIKKEYGIEYIITEHSSSFARNMLSEKELLYATKVFSNAAYRIAVSKEFTVLLNKLTKNDFVYIPNIVNVDSFNIKDKKNSDIFKFINVGSLLPNKNHKLLIDAFEKSFKGKNNIQLIIVGYGVMYNELNRYISNKGLTKQIQLIGKADRKRLIKLLQESNAFVLSSDYETFGVVIIEAMACGLPIVSTKSGGPESIITSEDLGLLCDNNINSLSNAMNILYNNINIYNPNQIRTYAIKNFSEAVVVRKILDIYNKVKAK